MDPVFENEILAVIARTKIHKDTFAIPGLIRILQSELEKHQRGRSSPGRHRGRVCGKSH